VEAVLREGDFYPDQAIAAFAWPLILQAGGLAELAGARLQLTAKGTAALAAPPERTIRDLWRRWLSNAVIDEMSRVEAIRGQRSARALTAAGPRRKAVGQALAACSAGEWLDVEDLLNRMSRRGLFFTVARDLWKLYLVHPQYGSLGYEGYGDWSLLEGRYTLAVLFEYAGTLWLFDLAYVDPEGARSDFTDRWGADDLDGLSRYDGLLGVRLNALGAYVVAQTPTYRAEPEPPAPGAGDRPLKVLPNHDVVVVGELARGDRLVLETFAEQSSERVWSLRMSALLTAIGAGRGGDELLSFLRDRSATAVPDTVVRLLDDAAERGRQVRDDGVVRLVTCADPSTAALIADDRRVRGYCRLVGDRQLAVPLEHDAKFRAALPAAGFVLPPSS